VPNINFSLILHAHLPFVRHPEYPEFLEEDWLYEAITEVYLPLLFVFTNLADSGYAPRLAINLSPPLCEMLADELLQTRYARHLDNLRSLAAKELQRTAHEAREFHPAAQMYHETFEAAAGLFNDRYNRNILNGFRELQQRGVLEIITCGATHGFLPLISTPEARRAQIQVAVRNYQKHFNRAPRGIWLPECAYEPGIENLLAEAGLEYFIADSHAITYGDPRPRRGVFAPVRCPNGVGVFARDVETSEQVWSSVIGYPGDAVYREFYRDLGWDAEYEYLKPHLHKDGARRHLGIKYHRITGRGVEQNAKLPYHPETARARAAFHAAHFVNERVTQAARLRETFDDSSFTPLVVSPYDAELYGHWWHEGVQFLDFMFRNLHERRDEVRALTPGDFLNSGAPIQTQQPSASSWGADGYYKVWLNEGTTWMYPHQHAAEERMTALATRFREGAPDEATHRALNQLARELLLAESSDWAFQIYQGTTVEYAARRFRSHIRRFNAIADGIESGNIDHEQLAEIESRDNIFAEIDYRVYCVR
jgi:1,4-alpha-glucan branching enzyme